MITDELQDGWLYHDKLQEMADMVFTHVKTPEERLEWEKKMVQHSGPSFANELTHAGYADVPVSYLFCEEDICVRPEIQQAGIDRIEKASGKKVDVTSIKGDHAPMITQEEVVVDWLVSLGQKGEEW